MDDEHNSRTITNTYVWILVKKEWIEQQSSSRPDVDQAYRHRLATPATTKRSGTSTERVT